MLPAAELTGLLQNDLQGDKNHLSVNSDIPLGCVNFYSTSLELWMAAPVFTVGIGDKLCTSLNGLSLLLHDGLSKETRDSISWC